MNNDLQKEQNIYKASQENKDKIIKELLSMPIDDNFMKKTKKEIIEEKRQKEIIEEKRQKEIVKPKYKSKKGFITTKVNRGYQEIKNVLKLIDEFELKCFVLGGYVRYMCSPKKNPYPAADLDIYSHSMDDYKRLRELIENMNVNGKLYKMSIKHENEVSITFKEVEDINHPFFITPTIQLIKPLKKGSMVLEGDMQTVLENFDFSVVRCGLINEDEALVDADFLHDETNSMLRLKNIHCPISSTIRCVKYGKKGYWMTPMESLKLFIDWDNRDDNYKMSIIDTVAKFKKEGITRKEIEHLEALMRID